MQIFYPFKLIKVVPNIKADIVAFPLLNTASI